MRDKTNQKSIERLMQLLGRRARSTGTVYFTGGASAVLMGWRDTTLDVDLKLAPEPAGVFEAIRDAKEELGINIELAAPDDFIPAVPGWQARSGFIAQVGPVEFRHYDFYGQALAKIERGHRQDVQDVDAMLANNLVEPTQLRTYFDAITDQMLRYPALDAATFRAKLNSALKRLIEKPRLDAD